MENLEKYNNAFVEVFGVKEADLHEDFGKETIEEWDSVHQLSLIAALEESFNIMLDPEDIMEFISYLKGKELLRKYNINI